MKNKFSDLSELDEMKDHPVSGQIDDVFKDVIKEEKKSAPESLSISASEESDGLDLSLDADGEFEINLGGDEEISLELPGDEEISLGSSEDEGLELSFAEEDGFALEDSDTESDDGEEDMYGDLSLDSEEEEGLSLDDPGGPRESFPELSLSDNSEEAPDLPSDEGLSFDNTDLGGEEASLALGDDDLQLDSDLSLNFSADENLDLSFNEVDLSDDAKEKLKEIDAIMDYDASQVAMRPQISPEENLDEPLVSPDLDLGSLNFGEQISEEAVAAPIKEERPKKKKKEAAEARESRDRDFSEDLKEISGAYSGEMERMQATISNLRADREELMNKIQKFEEEKLLQSRQTLSIRAELDERKIELTIIRKKLNEEVNDLKDRLKLYDEKRLILEEKNRVLLQELDKAAQKNKIDVKKVQMRERELEQKLELLKSDAETQIRNRDLKILELKRKIDSMEFDMESISMQEKRSVESRYELEDKLEKAIKTLRGAITVLEDESDRSNALETLKKNIDM